jgi:hypothetical protein
MKGRKKKPESRATEFRQRLVIRKQTPESLRPSLRQLARELGTSHFENDESLPSRGCTNIRSWTATSISCAVPSRT